MNINLRNWTIEDAKDFFKVIFLFNNKKIN